VAVGNGIFHHLTNDIAFTSNRANDASLAVTKVGRWPSFGSHAPLKFLIQAASARFPYRIRMVCGDVEIRMLNLKTIRRLRR
jgi:hypothetical protein